MTVLPYRDGSSKRETQDELLLTRDVARQRVNPLKKLNEILSPHWLTHSQIATQQPATAVAAEYTVAQTLARLTNYSRVFLVFCRP